MLLDFSVQNMPETKGTAAGSGMGLKCTQIFSKVSMDVCVSPQPGRKEVRTKSFNSEFFEDILQTDCWLWQCLICWSISWGAPISTQCLLESLKSEPWIQLVLG